MVREIKFRAWYNKDKKMCVVNEISELPTKTIWDDGSILMQYTGLKDKNGKEIYEGDIVKTQKTRKSKVIWIECEGGFALEFINDLQSSSDYLDEHEGDLEVIGNIYEDKKLLKCNQK